MFGRTLLELQGKGIQWLTADSDSDASSQTSTKDKKPSDDAVNLPWVLLALNKEARTYARKRYFFAYQSRLFDHDGPIYIDFERDTFSFGGFGRERHLATMLKSTKSDKGKVFASLSTPFSTCADDVIHLVRKIAIRDPPEDFFMEVLSKMPNLERADFAEEIVAPVVSGETLEDSDPWMQKLIVLRNQIGKEQGKEVKIKRPKGRPRKKGKGKEPAAVLQGEGELPVIGLWDHDDWDKEFWPHLAEFYFLGYWDEQSDYVRRKLGMVPF